MGPNYVLDKGFQATTAVGKFRAVTLTANDAIKQADAAAQFAIGVCQETITAGDATNGRIVDVRIEGITRAVNGVAGALARMAKCATDTTGRMVVATAGQAVVGIAITASAAQGDHFDLLLTPGAVA